MNNSCYIIYLFNDGLIYALIYAFLEFNDRFSLDPFVLEN